MNSNQLSGIAKLKQRMQESGLHTNQTNKPSDHPSKPNQPSSQTHKIQQKERPSSLPKKTSENFASTSTSNYQNLSRKQTQPGESIKNQPKKAGEGVKKKQNMKSMIFNPINQLKPANQIELKQQREKFDTLEVIPENQNPLDPIDLQKLNSSTQSIRDAMKQFQQKLDSAERRIDMPHLKDKKDFTVSSFETGPSLKQSKTQHNSDQLVNSEDHSDIKNSMKTLFDSTAVMSGKGMFATPINETSRFTLNVLGDSEDCMVSQFKTVESIKTDDQGNRMSILPKEKRPEVPQSSKKRSETKLKISKKKDKKIEEEDDNKNLLEKMKEEVKKLNESKDISKIGERKNFVKINMNKNYKQRSRGAQFTNKIMAKKRNNLKFRENIKRKLQIERAKNRDQVNMYGGLGKVGLDHQGKINDEGEVEQEVAPTFSSSALKFVSKLQKLTKNENDEMLTDKLENITEEQDEVEEEKVEQSQSQQVDPDEKDEPLHQIPETDEGFVSILKQRFGFESFLEGQLEAIKLLLYKKESTLIVLATGAGKSLVYQYVSLFLSGLVIIVTPLISLMTDQLGKIPSFITAACLNSQQGFTQKRLVLQAIQEKAIKILFVSPERFFMEDFSKFNRQINMVCVDEIHCSSEWSHNFRPTYLKLHDMIQDKLGKDVLIIGLTATATKATQKSICQTFKIKYPDNIITQPNLSRLNLHLSITRDNEKQRALITLLKSDSFKKLNSILIYATQKRTTEQIASYLTQEGIQSQAYHAGKTDAQRQIIQKLFINNQIRVLVCTIAFSMGIDKSDIQSVIHYDMPRSVEGYVQEIGRAGRDGKLARCHMFLNNMDFYQIRRILLTDLLDNQNALKLTSRIIVEGKRSFLQTVNPEFREGKKRKLKKGSGEDKAITIEEFDYENMISEYYEKNEDGTQIIDVKACEDLEAPLYLFLNCKETQDLLDLKKEVILTMLHSLEKLEGGKGFFKLESMLPSSVGLRFHKTPAEEMAETNPFIREVLKIGTNHQGVIRCSIGQLAYNMKINPFQIPKILYTLQNSESGEISYELDHDSFVLKIKYLPTSSQILELSELMLKETRRIEENIISKLNCIYFIARKASLPTIDMLLKKEKQENADELYKGFSTQVNDLINLYFRIVDEGKQNNQICREYGGLNSWK